MTFIILKTQDDTDYYLSTSNIAGVKESSEAGVVSLAVQKGAEVEKRPGHFDQSGLQDVFYIYADKDTAQGRAAAELAAEISSAEQGGKTLDLRSRVYKL